MQVAILQSRASITCFSESFPIFYKGSSLVDINVIVGNVLVFSQIEWDDSGNYTCQGTRNDTAFIAHSILLVAGEVSQKFYLCMTFYTVIPTIYY